MSSLAILALSTFISIKEDRIQEHSEMVLDLEKLIIHPEYIENDEVSFHKNDIALIKLNKNVPFNDAIQRACWKEGDVLEPAAQDFG